MHDIVDKWSEILYNGIYVNCNESRQAVLGCFLVSLGINLEKLPSILFQPYGYFPSSSGIKKEYTVEKVCVRDIVGTTRQEYAEDNQILFSFMKLKRIRDHIMNGEVTRNKYLWMLKQKEQECPVKLSRNSDNTFYVNGDGNHRVIAYKIMMLAEIAQNNEMEYEDFNDLSFGNFDKISKKYWIYARVWKD